MRNYVERAQITFGSGRIGFNRANHHAFIGAFKQIADCRVVTERFNPNAQPGSHDFVASDQFGTDFLGHVNGDCEAQAAIHPVNQRIHANHLAIDVAQRSSAVARINRRVGLQIIGDGVGARLKQFAAAFAADYAVSEGVIELEWRPDRERKLTDPHRIAVTELDDRQILSVDLDDRNIGLFVSTHDPRRKIPTVPQFHLDFICAFDHMKVREDVTIWSNDKSGAFALDRAWSARVAPLITLIRWPLKEQVIEWRTFGDVVFLRNLYNDNTRCDGFEDFCKSIVQLMNDIFACLGCSGRDGLRGDSLRLRGERSTECNAQGQNG